MLPTKMLRFLMLVLLIGAYLVLAICDIKEGRFRTGAVSFLFAIVTYLVFF